MADWRNRIVGLEYHKPGEIADHPLQWRVHSTAQEAALRAVLSEVGIAGALLAYRNNGDLVAIDGHLRKSLDADAEWPVLLLDVTEDEANKLLATTDPLAAMAGADAAMLGDLLAVIETENDTLQALLDGLAEEHGIVAEEPPDDPGAQIDKAEELREKWGVELGQVWEIGEHRLVCGDCTDAAVVAAVMRGERAQLCFTSPPYNAGVSAKLRGNTSIVWRRRKTHLRLLPIHHPLNNRRISAVTTNQSMFAKSPQLPALNAPLDAQLISPVNLRFWCFWRFIAEYQPVIFCQLLKILGQIIVIRLHLFE